MQMAYSAEHNLNSKQLMIDIKALAEVMKEFMLLGQIEAWEERIIYCQEMEDKLKRYLDLASLYNSREEASLVYCLWASGWSFLSDLFDNRQCFDAALHCFPVEGFWTRWWHLSVSLAKRVMNMLAYPVVREAWFVYIVSPDDDSLIATIVQIVSTLELLFSGHLIRFLCTPGYSHTSFVVSMSFKELWTLQLSQTLAQSYVRFRIWCFHTVFSWSRMITLAELYSFNPGSRLLEVTWTYC